jgi:hypothetical protein
LRYKRKFGDLVVWLQQQTRTPADLKHQLLKLRDCTERSPAPHPGDL